MPWMSFEAKLSSLFSFTVEAKWYCAWFSFLTLLVHFWVSLIFLSDFCFCFFLFLKNSVSRWHGLLNFNFEFCISEFLTLYSAAKRSFGIALLECVHVFSPWKFSPLNGLWLVPTNLCLHILIFSVADVTVDVQKLESCMMSPPKPWWWSEAANSASFNVINRSPWLSDWIIYLHCY